MLLGWIQLCLPEAMPVAPKLSFSRTARTSKVLPFMLECVAVLVMSGSDVC